MSLASLGKAKQHGFALAETALIIVIIGVIGGVGYWVTARHKKSVSNPASAAQTAAAGTAASLVAPAGTTAAVDQTVDNEINDEQQADDKATANINNDVKSDQTSANNIGDSYNENNF